MCRCGVALSLELFLELSVGDCIQWRGVGDSDEDDKNEDNEDTDDDNDDVAHTTHHGNERPSSQKKLSERARGKSRRDERQGGAVGTYI
jgi:hypothetical protein